MTEACGCGSVLRSSPGCQNMSAWDDDRLDYCREKLSLWILVGHKIRNCVSISSRSSWVSTAAIIQPLKYHQRLKHVGKLMRLLTKQICSSQTKIMIILLLLMGIKRDKGNGEIQESRKWMNVLRARFGKCLIPGDIISVLWQGDMWTLSLMWWRLLARSQDTPRLSVSHSLLWRDFLPCPAPATFDLRRTQPATGQSEKMEKNRKTGN